MEKEIEKRFSEIEKRLALVEKSQARTPREGKQGKWIFCVYCEHPWPTVSKNKLVSCPNCGKKTPTDISEIRARMKESARKVDEFIKRREEQNKKYPTRFGK